MKYNNLTLFIILCSVTFSSVVFSKEILETEKLVYNTLAESFTEEQLFEIIQINNRWGWIPYLFIPLLLYLKISLIAVSLSNGAFFFNEQYKFRQLFNIVVKAEFIFLLPIVFKTGYYYFFRPDYTINDLENFMPLSLEHLFGYENFEKWYIYPLQTVNIFEVIYWIVLTLSLSKTLKTSLYKAFMITLTGYGLALFIWIICIMFITLNTTAI